MKRSIYIAFAAMLCAGPSLAQTTTTGGGPNISVQSAKGSGTVRDTTSHTTSSNGVVVSTSTGRDGKPNGGAGGGSAAPQSGGGGASYEGH